MLLHSANNIKKEGTVHCTLCPYVSDTVDTMKTHLICHATETSFRVHTCDHCQFVTDDMDNMDTHLTEVHDKCEYRFMVSKIVYVPGECIWCSDSVLGGVVADHLRANHKSYMALALDEGAVPYEEFTPDDVTTDTSDTSDDIRYEYSI